MMRRLEALADAFANMCDALNPDSEAYELRNPILLKAFSPRHARNDRGHRRFNNFVAGYENALLDLRIKCSGRTRAPLTPESELINLVTTYGHPPTAIKYIIKFLRRALRDESLPIGVRLGWFLADEEDKNGRKSTDNPAA